MGRRRWVVVSALVGVVVGCGTGTPATSPPSTPSAVETPHPAAPRATAPDLPDLPGAVARAVEAAGGIDLGLTAVDLDTGAGAGHDADVPFRSASLSKLLVAVDLLLSGEVPQEDVRRLERALGLSDDEAMNALWTLHDGVGAIRRVVERVGLTATGAPADATQWGDVEMSAADVARLYRFVLTELPADDRDFVVDALSGAGEIAADGFDQAYGLMAPGTDAYAKQGWMWYLPADLYLHTAGVAGGRYVVVALSRQSGVAEREAKDRLTGVTGALLSALSRAG
ncbi:hypothetical protein Q5530_14800 [Saccharothrix sp. BKS2]|uniref:hypothetical protein n=1 Tax=Saccharothrix sp. BKS2 TaxID=3064400 RepID=UPI0039E8D7AF